VRRRRKRLISSKTEDGSWKTEVASIALWILGNKKDAFSVFFLVGCL